MLDLILDNKPCPLKVPGFHGIPIDVELPQDQFAVGIKDWRGTILTAKELAMLDLINTITERPDWHTWSWCLKELQDKATDFEKRGYVLVLNTGSGVCKSDTAISGTTQSQLQDAAVSLIKDLEERMQYENLQKSPVVHLIDPSLFPLVYGRTKVLTGGNPVEWTKAHIFFFEHSDPGTAYSYEDWKAGRTGEAIVGPADQSHWDPVFETEQFLLSNPWLEPYRWAFEPKAQKDDDHEFYTVALQDEVREKGLQVVVKIHSVELGPDTPVFPGEDWHTEGNANEHIVANAIYTFDSENISEPQISFRQRLWHAGGRYVYDKIGAGDDPDDDESDFEDQQNDDDDDAWIYERDPEAKYACWDLKYLGRLFGFENIQYAPAWQELGRVRMPPGRLISFPNAFQHRMGPLELQDKTKLGHCRFLTLCLVDPPYRICSTRNVPPQQPNWTDGSGPQMDLKEALKLKEELMKEHARKDEATFELAGNLVFSGVS
ncbi:hypothetical protein CDV55_102773 [Aspergillus turcosus]|nr:hypothetical protein CDV55_102773 [Aspergillus turcosus]